MSHGLLYARVNLKAIRRDGRGATSIRSLNNFRLLRKFVIKIRNRWLRLRHGVLLDAGSSLSMSATVIAGKRGSIQVGDGTLIAFKTLLLAREPDGTVRPIKIGRNCFIGGGAVILPGVSIGDGCIVGAGAVVFDDIPPRCVIGGNPARIIREDINAGRFGRFDYADENSRRLYR